MLATCMKEQGVEEVVLAPLPEKEVCHIIQNEKRG